MGYVKLTFLCIIVFLLSFNLFSQALKFDGEILSRADNKIFVKPESIFETEKKLRAEVYTPYKIAYLPGTKDSIINEWILSGEIEIMPSTNNDTLEGIIVKESIPDTIERGSKILLLPNRSPEIIILNLPKSDITQESIHLIKINVTDPENDDFIIKWHTDNGKWIHKQTKKQYNFFIAPSEPCEATLKFEVKDIYGKTSILEKKLRITDFEPKPFFKCNYTLMEGQKETKPFIDAVYDKKGMLYVLLKDEIKIFNPNGAMASQIKTPFNSSAKLKIDDKDNIYVLDTNKKTIFKINHEGKILLEIRDLSESGDTLKLDTPIDFAIDNKNRIFLLDQVLCRIIVFDNSANITAAIGAKGNAASQMSFPKAIETDKKGNIYLLDEGSLSLKIFTPTFDIIKTISLNENFKYIDLILHPYNDSIYILAESISKSHDEKYHLIKCDNSNAKTFPIKISNEIIPLSSCFDWDENILIMQSESDPIIKINTEGKFIELFQKENIEKDSKLARGYFKTIFFESDKSIKRMNHSGWIDKIYPASDNIHSMTVDANDFLYIVEKNTNKVRKFDNNGRHIEDFSLPFSSKDKLYGIIASSDKNIFVLKAPLYLAVLSTSGSFIKEVNLEHLIPKQDKSNSKFLPISSYHLDKYNRLIFSDKSKKEVLIINETFSNITIIDKEFDKIGDISSDSYGNIYILDIIKKTIYVFNKNARLKREISLKNETKKPTKLLVFGDGEIFVFDEIKKCIFQYY